MVAWELFTGRRPFEAQTPAAEAAAHVQAPVPSISAANRDLPRAFDPIFERALAKDPEQRVPDRGRVRRRAAPRAGRRRRLDLGRPRNGRPDRSPPRRRVPAALIVAAIAVALAGIAAAVIATRGGDGSTVLVRTVTRPGTTVERTITTSPQTSRSRPADGAALNNAGFAKMQAGDYNGALPLLEQAVSALQGAGSLDEAYADYNLAYTRFALGNCTGVLDLLDRSQQIQGHRKEIDHLRHDAHKSCQDEG